MNTAYIITCAESKHTLGVLIAEDITSSELTICQMAKEHFCLDELLDIFICTDEKSITVTDSRGTQFLTFEQTTSYQPLNQQSISIKWHISDILVTAEQEQIECSENEAKEILASIHRNHDSEYGITWDTIRSELDKLQEKRSQPQK